MDVELKALIIGWATVFFGMFAFIVQGIAPLAVFVVGFGFAQLVQAFKDYRWPELVLLYRAWRAFGKA